MVAQVNRTWDYGLKEVQMTSKVGSNLTAEQITGMNFKDLVAQFATQPTDEDLESVTIDELKTSIGPLRVPVKAYAEISKLADEADMSIGNFVLHTVGEALQIVLPMAEGKGRKRSTQTKEEITAAARLKSAKNAAQVQRVLAELGAS